MVGLVCVVFAEVRRAGNVLDIYCFDIYRSNTTSAKYPLSSVNQPAIVKPVC